jgi:hypothetical protein
VNTAPTNVPPPSPPANATEELKKQAARLQEQLSSMLFSEAPGAKQIEPAPGSTPVAISEATTKTFEISKAEPSTRQEKPEPEPETKALEP